MCSRSPMRNERTFYSTAQVYVNDNSFVFEKDKIEYTDANINTSEYFKT